MRSLLSRRPLRRRSLAVLCALAALVVSDALPSSASAVVVRSSVFTTVTGTHFFPSVSQTYNVTGNVSITSRQAPTDPCRLLLPTDPCRTLTIATVLRLTNGPNTCSFTGATSQAVAVAPTYSVDAVVQPSDPVAPIAQPTDPCRQLGTFAVRYNLAISADNVITSVVAQTEPVT